MSKVARMLAGKTGVARASVLVALTSAATLVVGFALLRPSGLDAREVVFPLSLEYQVVQRVPESDVTKQARLRWDAEDWDHWSRFVLSDPALSDHSSRERELHLDQSRGEIQLVWPDGTEEVTEAPDGPMAPHELLRPTLTDARSEHNVLTGTRPDEDSAARVAQALGLDRRTVEGRRWQHGGACEKLRGGECGPGGDIEGAISGVIVYHRGLHLPLLVEERLDREILQRLEVTAITR